MIFSCSWVWLLFPLLCRRALVWYSPICSVFLFDAEPFEFSLGSHSLYLSVPVHFLLLLRVVSGVQTLYQGVQSTLSWFWYRVKNRNLVSVFYMWISSFPSSIVWRVCLFSIVCFGPLCQRSVGYRCIGLCLDLLLVHWSSCLFLCQYHAVIIVMAL
jgi:hypothetical protein